MKIIICKPGKRAEQRVVREELTLKAMQEIVGGNIEVVHADGLPKGAVIICNEEGKLLDLPANRWISLNGVEDLICGTFFICAIDEGNLVPLKDEQAAKIAMHLDNLTVNTFAPAERRCCLCGAPLDEGEGNNAAPLMDGDCCDRCNAGLVVPERIKGMRDPQGPQKERRSWSVSDQLMAIGERICDDICKYHDQLDALDTDEDYDAICGNCPLNLLV